jgi:hypothetical protein
VGSAQSVPDLGAKARQLHCLGRLDRKGDRARRLPA